MPPTNNQFSVSQPGLLASIWIMTAFASALSILRPLVRHFIFRRLYWDDALQSVAWLLLLGQSIAYTYWIPTNYELSAIQAGTGPQPSKTKLASLLHQIYIAELVLPLLFWTCLFCVKLSVLWLYRHALRGSGKSTKAWWATHIAVIVCYGVVLIGLFAECGPARNLTNAEACASPSSVKLSYRFTPMQFTFNVFSDLLVMILPLPMLWKLQMPTRQKIAVTAVFSLAWVTIAMEILRIVETYRQLPEVTWLYTSLQAEVAVIVGALPAFSFLVSDSIESKQKRSLLLFKLSNRSGDSGNRLPSIDPVDSTHTDERYLFGGSAKDSISLHPLPDKSHDNV